MLKRIPNPIKRVFNRKFASNACNACKEYKLIKFDEDGIKYIEIKPKMTFYHHQKEFDLEGKELNVVKQSIILNIDDYNDLNNMNVNLFTYGFFTTVFHIVTIIFL